MREKSKNVASRKDVWLNSFTPSLVRRRRLIEVGIISTIKIVAVFL